MAGFGWNPGFPQQPQFPPFPLPSIPQIPSSSFWMHPPCYHMEGSQHRSRSRRMNGRINYMWGSACFWPSPFLPQHSLANAPQHCGPLEEVIAKKSKKNNLHESHSSDEEQDFSVISDDSSTDEEEECDSNYYWKTLKTVDDVPENAVVGGEDEGRKIYVAKAKHAADEMPAKVIPEIYYAAVSYAGKEVPVKKYKVLCERKSFKWVESGNGSYPKGAVPGGKTVDGETLYIGRARHCGQLIVGKVHPSHRCMFIAHCNKEHRALRYEVLVYS